MSNTISQKIKYVCYSIICISAIIIITFNYKECFTTIQHSNNYRSRNDLSNNSSTLSGKNYLPYNTTKLLQGDDNHSVFPTYHFIITDSDLPLTDKNYVEILIWLFINLEQGETQPLYLDKERFQNRLVIFQRQLSIIIPSAIGDISLSKNNSTLTMSSRAAIQIQQLESETILSILSKAKRSYWKKWVKPGRTPRTKSVNVLPTSTDVDAKIYKPEYATESIVIQSPPYQFFLTELDHYYQQIKEGEEDEENEENENINKDGDSVNDYQPPRLEKKDYHYRLSSPNDTDYIEFGNYPDTNSSTMSNEESTIPHPVGKPRKLPSQTMWDFLPNREDRPIGWNKQRFWQESLSPSYLNLKN